MFKTMKVYANVLCFINLDLENLSYMKQTWQSSTYSAYGTSDKAVDGHFSSRHFRDGQCALGAANQRRVTWWVNLGKIYRINHVVLVFRTDNIKWSADSNGYTAAFLGFYLYVSNTTNRHQGILCHHDTTFTRHTIPDTVSINCPYFGKYVIFYNERLPRVVYPSDYSTYAYGDLCEVQVYGCPSPIAEISQCTRPCPLNCEKCYPGTGICSKCFIGFEGYACEIACHAVAIVSSSTMIFIPVKFIYNMLKTSQGILFAGEKSGMVGVYMTLPETSSSIAKLSFTLKIAKEVNVTFYDRDHLEIKKHQEKFTELQQMDVTVLNDKISKVYYILMTVEYIHEFTISNLRLPLRKCYGNSIDMEEPTQDGFKYV
nr:uncharacterized protein LOC117689079 isoform X2 [Crassostrea gigas]